MVRDVQCETGRKGANRPTAQGDSAAEVRPTRAGERKVAKARGVVVSLSTAAMLFGGMRVLLLLGSRLMGLIVVQIG